MPEKHFPRRNDQVAIWLKNRRDEEKTNKWEAIDDLLDIYRLHSDTGTALNDPLGEEADH